MNKNLLLELLINKTDKNFQKYKSLRKSVNFEGLLWELNNRRGKLARPVSVPRLPEAMISVLREHFKNNVTFISLFLNHYFPNRFLFYRVSKLETEIFEGFQFFSDIVSGFDFPFQKIGRNGFEHYCKLNEVLLDFGKRQWPSDKNLQDKLLYFMYEGLGRMFTQFCDCFDRSCTIKKHNIPIFHIFPS
jgi:hypothetical protein